MAYAIIRGKAAVATRSISGPHGTVKANEYRSFSASNLAERILISEQKQWGSIPRRRASWQYRI